MRISVIAALLTLMICTPTLASEPLVSGASLHFASVDEGQKLVSTSDAFVKALSRFDRQVRLQTDGDAAEEALLKFVAGEVIAWDDGAQQKVIESIERIRAKLEPFRLPLPPTVLLIQMSGKDESNAAYTRGAAILLPRDRVEKLKSDALDRLMLHELFHVLSRHAPELRRDLYRIIGFQVCEPIALPLSLADLKLTNPDAPLIDCHIELAEDGETFDAAPILYSSSDAYDAVNKPPLFRYLVFRLMKVEQKDGRWIPILKDDAPILVDPASSKSFAGQIGQNTKYIIHPDEILADNFVHLVMQTQNLPSPKIVDEMGKLLRKHD